MLFTSYSFILFVFLTISLYYIIPKKYQWKLLLLSSFIFYYFSGVTNLVYISVTIASTYFIGLKIGRLGRSRDDYLKANKELLPKEDKKKYKEAIKSKQRFWLILCLVFNFGILAVLKYTNFTIANINSIIGLFNGQKLSFVNIILPLGISFYTFMTMGYIIDVYREKYQPERNIGKLALFVSFFPQLIQGPISRYDDMGKTLFSENKFDSKNFYFGLQRVLWGFFKKIVIADRIVVAVNTIINKPEIYDGVFVFVGMVFYAIRLYADFTGGIDITIGIAQMLGVNVKENFQRPFFSKSIVEYWRRWHITLGTWFKEYLFYPISVCKPMLNLSKFSRNLLGEKLGKRVPVYLATIAVWFTTGIWHGASWNFVVWGLLNCFVILVSQEFEPLYEKFHKRFSIGKTFAFRLFQVIRTFLLMCSLRILDCYKSVEVSFKMFGSMFTLSNLDKVFQGALLKLGLSISDYIVLTASVILLIIISLKQRKGSIREEIHGRVPVLRYAIYVLLLFAILLFGAYGIGYDSNQFIYNQF